MINAPITQLFPEPVGPTTLGGLFEPWVWKRKWRLTTHKTTRSSSVIFDVAKEALNLLTRFLKENLDIVKDEPKSSGRMSPIRNSVKLLWTLCQRDRTEASWIRTGTTWKGNGRDRLLMQNLDTNLPHAVVDAAASQRGPECQSTGTPVSRHN